MDRFHFYGSKNSFGAAVREHLGQKELNDQQVVFILEYIEAHVGVGANFEHRVGKVSSDTLELRVGQIVIDIPNALLVTAAASMDALWTRGAAMALLAASGRDLRAWARLDPKNGEFCNFLTIEEKASNEPIDPAQISERTKRRPCIHPDIGCNYDFEGACCISTDRISENLLDLAQRRAIEIDKNGNAIRKRI